MGTRADFYIGRGKDAQWLASIAWDGYPEGIEPEGGWKGGHLFKSKTAEQFKSRLEKYLAGREDVSLPKDGWPWPWDDSRTTDYAYAFDGGKVWAACLGHPWFNPNNPPEDQMAGAKEVEFPNMKDRANVQFGGSKSGLIVITAAKP